MTDLEYAESIFVARPPEAVYALVSDITRMGEWSPICRECWWDEQEDGGSGRAGDWFFGRNEDGDRVWETRSQVVVADPPREFAFVVGGDVDGGRYVRWSYGFALAEGGTTLSEHWSFLPGGLALFDERYGDAAGAQVEQRRQAAHRSIPATLAAIKKAAESS